MQILRFFYCAIIFSTFYIPTALAGPCTAEDKESAEFWQNYYSPEEAFDFGETIKELVEAKKTEPQERINEEFGDLMFSIVNLGRHLKVDPEQALKQTNRKFITRFNFVESSLRSQGKKIEDTSLEEMEALWQQAKNP